jgi:predicted transglutaminase-like cysteine proteinase
VSETKKIGSEMNKALADAFSFVRSQEANQALAGVTLDQLIAEQIARNGESSASQKSVYNPYSYDTASDAEPESSPVSSEVSPAFVTGVNAQVKDGVLLAPTKLTRLEAIKETLNEAINSIKDIDPEQLVNLETLEEGGPIDEFYTLSPEDYVGHLSDVSGE